MYRKFSRTNSMGRGMQGPYEDDRDGFSPHEPPYRGRGGHPYRGRSFPRGRGFPPPRMRGHPMQMRGRYRGSAVDIRMAEGQNYVTPTISEPRPLINRRSKSMSKLRQETMSTEDMRTFPRQKPVTQKKSIWKILTGSGTQSKSNSSVYNEENSEDSDDEKNLSEEENTNQTKDDGTQCLRNKIKVNTKDKNGNQSMNDHEMNRNDHQLDKSSKIGKKSNVRDNISENSAQSSGTSLSDHREYNPEENSKMNRARTSRKGNPQNEASGEASGQSDDNSNVRKQRKKRTNKVTDHSQNNDIRPQGDDFLRKQKLDEKLSDVASVRKKEQFRGNSISSKQFEKLKEKVQDSQLENSDTCKNDSQESDRNTSGAVPKTTNRKRLDSERDSRSSSKSDRKGHFSAEPMKEIMKTTTKSFDGEDKVLHKGVKAIDESNKSNFAENQTFSGTHDLEAPNKVMTSKKRSGKKSPKRIKDSMSMTSNYANENTNEHNGSFSDDEDVQSRPRSTSYRLATDGQSMLLENLSKKINDSTNTSENDKLDIKQSSKGHDLRRSAIQNDSRRKYRKSQDKFSEQKDANSIHKTDNAAKYNVNCEIHTAEIEIDNSHSKQNESQLEQESRASTSHQFLRNENYRGENETAEVVSNSYVGSEKPEKKKLSRQNKMISESSSDIETPPISEISSADLVTSTTQVHVRQNRKSGRDRPTSVSDVKEKQIGVKSATSVRSSSQSTFETDEIGIKNSNETERTNEISKGNNKNSKRAAMNEHVDSSTHRTEINIDEKIEQHQMKTYVENQLIDRNKLNTYTEEEYYHMHGRQHPYFNKRGRARGNMRHAGVANVKSWDYRRPSGVSRYNQTRPSVRGRGYHIQNNSMRRNINPGFRRTHSLPGGRGRGVNDINRDINNFMDDSNPNKEDMETPKKKKKTIIQLIKEFFGISTRRKYSTGSSEYTSEESITNESHESSDKEEDDTRQGIDTSVNSTKVRRPQQRSQSATDLRSKKSDSFTRSDPLRSSKTPSKVEMDIFRTVLTVRNSMRSDAQKRPVQPKSIDKEKNENIRTSQSDYDSSSVSSECADSENRLESPRKQNCEDGSNSINNEITEKLQRKQSDDNYEDSNANGTLGVETDTGSATGTSDESSGEVTKKERRGRLGSFKNIFSKLKLRRSTRGSEYSTTDDDTDSEEFESQEYSCSDPDDNEILSRNRDSRSEEQQDDELELHEKYDRRESEDQSSSDDRRQGEYSSEEESESVSRLKRSSAMLNIASVEDESESSESYVSRQTSSSHAESNRKCVINNGTISNAVNEFSVEVDMSHNQFVYHGDMHQNQSADRLDIIQEQLLDREHMIPNRITNHEHLMHNRITNHEHMAQNRFSDHEPTTRNQFTDEEHFTHNRFVKHEDMSHNQFSDQKFTPLPQTHHQVQYEHGDVTNNQITKLTTSAYGDEEYQQRVEHQRQMNTSYLTVDYERDNLYETVQKRKVRAQMSENHTHQYAAANTQTNSYCFSSDIKNSSQTYYSKHARSQRPLISGSSRNSHGIMQDPLEYNSRDNSKYTLKTPKEEEIYTSVKSKTPRQGKNSNLHTGESSNFDYMRNDNKNEPFYADHNENLSSASRDENHFSLKKGKVHSEHSREVFKRIETTGFEYLRKSHENSKQDEGMGRNAQGDQKLGSSESPPPYSETHDEKQTTQYSGTNFINIDDSESQHTQYYDRNLSRASDRSSSCKSPSNLPERIAIPSPMDNGIVVYKIIEDLGSNSDTIMNTKMDSRRTLVGKRISRSLRSLNENNPENVSRLILLPARRLSRSNSRERSVEDLRHSREQSLERIANSQERLLELLPDSREQYMERKSGFGEPSGEPELESKERPVERISDSRERPMEQRQDYRENLQTFGEQNMEKSHSSGKNSTEKFDENVYLTDKNTGDTEECNYFSNISNFSNKLNSGNKIQKTRPDASFVFGNEQRTGIAPVTSSKLQTTNVYSIMDPTGATSTKVVAAKAKSNPLNFAYNRRTNSSLAPKSHEENVCNSISSSICYEDTPIPEFVTHNKSLASVPVSTKSQPTSMKISLGTSTSVPLEKSVQISKIEKVSTNLSKTPTVTIFRVPSRPLISEEKKYSRPQAAVTITPVPKAVKSREPSTFSTEVPAMSESLRSEQIPRNASNERNTSKMHCDKGVQVENERNEFFGKSPANVSTIDHDDKPNNKKEKDTSKIVERVKDEMSSDTDKTAARYQLPQTPIKFNSGATINSSYVPSYKRWITPTPWTSKPSTHSSIMSHTSIKPSTSLSNSLLSKHFAKLPLKSGSTGENNSDVSQTKLSPTISKSIDNNNGKSPLISDTNNSQTNSPSPPPTPPLSPSYFSPAIKEKTSKQNLIITDSSSGDSSKEKRKTDNSASTLPSVTSKCPTCSSPISPQSQSHQSSNNSKFTTISYSPDRAVPIKVSKFGTSPKSSSETISKQFDSSLSAERALRSPTSQFLMTSNSPGRYSECATTFERSSSNRAVSRNNSSMEQPPSVMVIPATPPVSSACNESAISVTPQLVNIRKYTPEMITLQPQSSLPTIKEVPRSKRSSLPKKNSLTLLKPSRPPPPPPPRSTSPSPPPLPATSPPPMSDRAFHVLE